MFETGSSLTAIQSNEMNGELNNKIAGQKRSTKKEVFRMSIRAEAEEIHINQANKKHGDIEITKKSLTTKLEPKKGG